MLEKYNDVPTKDLYKTVAGYESWIYNVWLFHNESKSILSRLKDFQMAAFFFGKTGHVLEERIIMIGT